MDTAPDPTDKAAIIAFHRVVHARWKNMLGEWWKVLNTATHEEAMQCWENFKGIYNNNIFGRLVEYIQREWLNEPTKQCILNYFANTNFHVDMRTTSRGKGSHA
jgi:hypothetical protein